jgi:hypothetical protein
MTNTTNVFTEYIFNSHEQFLCIILHLESSLRHQYQAILKKLIALVLCAVDFLTKFATTQDTVNLTQNLIQKLYTCKELSIQMA